MINQSLLLAGDDAYNLSKSLRFRSSASATLSRTPASSSNQQKWTLSAWVKRGTIYDATLDNYIFGAGSSGSNRFLFGFGNTTENLAVVATNSGSNVLVLNTTPVYRDPSAWYHMVLAIDTTQATSSNRAILYVNGVQVTAFSTATYPAQNTNLVVNATNAHAFGSRGYAASDYFDGYMAEVNFIDGQQLTPSSFGETDVLTGVWKPKKYTGTYGTNGFYLPFTPASTSYAASFNGSNQTLQIPNHSSFNIGTNDYCMEGWFYFNSLGSVQNLWGSDNGSGSTPKFLALANTNGSLTLEFTNSGGVSFLVSSAGAVTTGKWHHIAYVRSSGTSSIYVDGVSVGSTSTSVNLSGLTQPFYIGWIGENYGSLFNGLISNFRYVTGSPVYTANFTPPTSALTAISGTQYLTLQNATIIDNSPNAFTITNNNGVSVSSANPFLYSVTKDYSGNGNNWTPNNISLTAGTTYDSMVDVPTMSALASNYCVLSPIDKYDNPPTDGNLKRVGVGHGGSPFSTCRGTIGVSSGKWYFEALNTGTVGSSGNNMIGVMTTTTSALNDTYGGSTTRSYQDNGGLQGDNSTGTVSSSGNGDIIMVAFDVDAGKMWVGKNGTWMNSGAPASGTGNVFTTLPTSPITPQISMYGNTGDTKGWILNFGQQGFTYTPPTGFVALNTFNLPEPSIKAGNKHFDAKTYTGTGTSTPTSVALNFQPDLVWGKARNVSDHHFLLDAIRGNDKYLRSSTTEAEQSAGQTMIGFNSSGFTAEYASYGNGAFNYVGWAFKGGNGTSSNTAGSITSTVSANPTAGFSVVTYTGNGTSGATVGHGLGVAPKMIIIKRRDGTEAWPVYHASLPSAAYYLRLNGTDAQDTATSFMNNTAPSSSVFTLGNGGFSNTNTWTYVAYCFAEVAGYSKFGSYTGNGSTDGTFVHLGFRPKYMMIKRTDTADSWVIMDTSRNPYNAVNLWLQAEGSNAESTLGTPQFDFISNGMKLRGSSSTDNASGGTYIYMAFAENPFKYSLAR